MELGIANGMAKLVEPRSDTRGGYAISASNAAGGECVIGDKTIFDNGLRTRITPSDRRERRVSGLSRN